MSVCVHVLLSVLQVEMVEVTQGEKSVLLPFRIKDDLSLDVTLLWRHEKVTVHAYQRGQNQSVLIGQDYEGRTEMKKDPLNNKDFSLTLKDLRLTDRGVYTCTVHNKDGHMLLQKAVTLSVRVPEVQMVETVKGVQSVLLPFTTDIKLQDVTAEWKHEDKKVPQGRAEMKKDPLTIGDLSLTLKDLHLTDSGVYTCTVYNKDGHMLLQKSVTLSVRVLQVEMVEVTQGEKSVLLPFRIKDDLPVDVTLLWRHENVTVHTYQRDQYQPDIQGRTEMNKDPLTTKDLSLTLKDLHLTDSGVYTCTVYNKDGHMLLQKSVTLSVREYQLEMVEVTQGKEFVLLPFKIKEGFTQDVKVEWKHKNKMVHEYQIGKDQCHLKGQDQKQRTEMKKDPLNTKDLSLTLKDLHLTDSGVYTCTVYNKDGHMLLQKSVTLSVRVPEVQMVETVKGVQSVLLPFTTDIKLQDVTAEWKHEDRKVPQGQAEMKKDPLTTGDLSLTLKDLHLTDSGVYTCTVYNKDGHMLLQKSVTLSVKEYQLEMVEVTQGKEFVLLPFKIKEGFTQDVKVEWKHKNKMVHEYQIGKDQCHLKGQDQKQRTEMKKDPLNTKDLSLTLKDLHLTDSGVYTCTVYNKDGHMLLRKSVTLSVRVPEVQMVETVKGVQSVLLPFTTDIKLQDVTAEWKHEDKKVHVYKGDQNQSYIQSRTEVKNEQIKNGDLSLTLKDLHLTDSGVYTCTVYNKDGHMLLQKSVTLSVKEYQLEMVEVTQGKEFVLLPFKIKEGFTQDVKVEWKHKNKMVHEYQIGKDQCHLKGQDQKQRTEMKKDPLNTKDLSLTLKDLHLTDSGVYTCTVYNKDGHMLLRKSVTLSVRGECYSCLSTVQNRYRFISNKTEFRD
uniref:Ig-like domain-containing protein n=1 Tax=Oreochromis niloticus TaxID=8128 RepID=A0A669BHC0_ORENI